MSLSRYAQTWELHVGAGVHVRLTESLNAPCNFHLELSGSRATPTAACRGAPSKPITQLPGDECREYAALLHSSQKPAENILATTPSRAETRRRLRHARRALSRAEQRNAARCLYRQLAQNPLFRRARHLSMYLPTDGEIDPRLLLAEARRRGKTTYLPVLNDWPRTRMVFQRVDANEALRRNRFRILEPTVNRARQRKVWALDLVLLPLVGFDDAGGRLGMGGGFYDRSLAYLTRRQTWKKPRLLGLAHECQKVGKLTQASWDVPLDAAVTDRGWY